MPFCDDALRSQIRSNFEQFERRAVTEADVRRAAVALVVIDEGEGADLPGVDQPSVWSESAALLLTRRSQSLRNHPGQWALPGGRLDGEETFEQTALRETHEEVDLALPAERVLGLLDDFRTRSGFAMTPVVVWGGPGLTPHPNPGEVASIHRIPVAEFMRDDAPMLEATSTSEHPILRMPVGDDYIAAPTAAILYQFIEVCIRGRATRVAHYEQPEFAWS
ncbi:MAG: CoA pyrophosphatase [Pseudomonadota bacterium]